MTDRPPPTTPPERPDLRCTCGDPVYVHSRYKQPNAGVFVYVCPRTLSGYFECADLPGWPPS